MYSSVWETHRRATERHLPYGITQVNVPHLNPNQAGWYSIPRGIKDWVDLGGWLYTEKVKALEHKRLDANSSLFQWNFESEEKTAPIFLRVQ